MKWPKVSVAVITYNQENFVRETIESVLAQDYPNMEIVVADDCSQDGTRAILGAYQEAHPALFKILLAEENSGVTHNCNRAFFACTGKYIAWLGGDDLFYPGKLTRQVKAMEENPDCPLSYHSAEVFDSDSGEILAVTSLNEPEKKSLAQVLWAGVAIASSSVMVRKNACPISGFDESIPISSDWLFFLETLYRGCALKIEGIYGGYRRHTKNATNRSLIGDMEKSYEKIRSAKPELAKYVNRAMAISYYDEGRKQLMLLDQPAAARLNFKKALETDPTFVSPWPWLSLTYLGTKNIDALKQLKRRLKHKLHAER